MVFRKTDGLYWDLYVFDKLIARKLVFLKMVCDEPKYNVNTPDGIDFIPMDGDLVLKANNMEYYPVMEFYKSDILNFYGVAAIKKETDAICGFVCGRKERESGGEAKNNSFYIY